jgi:hypothetical protein
MMRSIPLLAALLLAPALAAAAPPVYKCTAGGKTAYSDRPCADGPSTVLPPVGGGIRPEGAETAPGQDARTLLEMDKLDMQREQDLARKQAQKQAQQAQREAQKLAQERTREEARADRSFARNVKAAEAKRKQCDRLRLRVKWAEEDLARARGKTKEHARIKAKRAQETMAVECPA